MGVTVVMSMMIETRMVVMNGRWYEIIVLHSSRIQQIIIIQEAHLPAQRSIPSLLIFRIIDTRAFGQLSWLPFTMNTRGSWWASFNVIISIALVNDLLVVRNSLDVRSVVVHSHVANQQYFAMFNVAWPGTVYLDAPRRWYIPFAEVAPGHVGPLQKIPILAAKQNGHAMISFGCHDKTIPRALWQFLTPRWSTVGHLRPRTIVAHNGARVRIQFVTLDTTYVQRLTMFDFGVWKEIQNLAIRHFGNGALGQTLRKGQRTPSAIARANARIGHSLVHHSIEAKETNHRANRCGMNFDVSIGKRSRMTAVDYCQLFQAWSNRLFVVECTVWTYFCILVAHPTMFDCFGTFYSWARTSDMLVCIDMLPPIGMWSHCQRMLARWQDPLAGDISPL